MHETVKILPYFQGCHITIKHGTVTDQPAIALEVIPPTSGPEAKIYTQISRIHPGTDTGEVIMYLLQEIHHTLIKELSTKPSQTLLNLLSSLH